MKNRPVEHSEDSETLHGAITDIIRKHGRGGLSFAARELGMTPSALRKRLQRPATAFDQPTLRAVILVIEINSRAQEQNEPPVRAANIPAPEE